MVAIAKEVIGRTADQSTDGSRSITRPWFVRGATSEAEAIAAVATEAPSIVDGLPLTHVSVDERVKDGYECEANYRSVKPPEPPATNSSQFNFEIATAPTRIVVPLSAQTVYPSAGLPAPADSDRWLIGQQGDGSPPEGVEVFEPNASFSETHWLPAASMTETYLRTILRIVGKISNASFRGWDAEEVLCTGVSGTKRGADDWEVSFRFGVKEHQSGMTVAGISGIDKKGWQFLWPRYELKMDGDAFILSNVVEYIVVADVFRTAAFSGLGIGS